jgi:DNA-directed RNA polymerase specialized sigma24 family protein
MLRGDEAQLYRDHHADLERSVRRAVNGPTACVEDACSFAWLQLLRLQPDRETVFGWLSVVAIREAWRLVARERRDRHLEAVPAWDERCGSANSSERDVAAREALATLAALPERQRRYLALFVAGYSYVEITQLCDATMTNVNKHLVRARGSVRRRSNGHR